MKSRRSSTGPATSYSMDISRLTGFARNIHGGLPRCRPSIHFAESLSIIILFFIKTILLEKKPTSQRDRPSRVNRGVALREAPLDAQQAKRCEHPMESEATGPVDERRGFMRFREIQRDPEELRKTNRHLIHLQSERQGGVSRYPSAVTECVVTR